jgi:chemotaxis family two-component system response regulator Rcp1
VHDRMTRKLLFVEDDEDDVFLIGRACKAAGVNALTEFQPNGKAASEHLANSLPVGGSLPQLIFLDLNMPVMGGLEFLRWLRRQPLLEYIPVVVLTTSENPDDLKAAYTARANAYVVKPANPSLWAEVLRCATEFWLVHNRVQFS